jgi:multidrug efflux pump subunit AcrB
MDIIEATMLMPPGVGYEMGWPLTRSGCQTQAPLLYAVSILFVFLCLAALYETENSIPFSVCLLDTAWGSWYAACQHANSSPTTCTFRSGC